MLKIKPCDHVRPSPDHFRHKVSPVRSPLYVVTAVSNPERYLSRYKHYRTFERFMQYSGVDLYTVELAFRDRHFEITEHDNPFHVQLRSPSELWHKENLINIGIRHLPHDWHYAAYIDADIIFSRPDWPSEAVHQLQHFDWVQLFSTLSDLGPDHKPCGEMSSFGRMLYHHDERMKNTAYEWGAPGGAWAFRREAFDAVGGLMDRCILGAADYHMAMGLVGKKNSHIEIDETTDHYVRYIREWSDRAASKKFHVGYIDNHALHYWHGPRKSRGYGSRWKILKDHAYNPYMDVAYDWQGVLNWAGNKRDFESDVRQYFRSRNEDEQIY